MSRNRMKKQPVPSIGMGVVKWVIIAGMLSVLGLSYMLCKNQNLHLAQETYRLDHQLSAIGKRNGQLTYDLDTMRSPVRLQRRLAQMRSTLVRLGDAGLTVVRMDQTVRARLVKMGTMPQGGIDYGAAPVASFGAPLNATPVQRPQ